MRLTDPQATLRAIATGMLLGALLSLCNIYSGLKIGWSTNMSITAALLGFAFWKGAEVFGRQRHFGILENNVSQTAASAGASISSAGLVSAIPALTLLTGQTLGWAALALWTFSVALVGVVVAVGLRRQMLVNDRLPFPYGVATAETVTEMYAKGTEALQRVYALLGAAGISAALKLAVEVLRIPKAYWPGAFAASGALAGKLSHVSLKNLTFAFDPSLLLVGAGALIGFRACASLMLGAIVGWGVLAPYALDQGFIPPGNPEKAWFKEVVNWLLWPGVSLMVSSSLTSFAFSWRSFLAAFRRGGAGGGPSAEETHDVPGRWLWKLLLVALALSVVLQVVLFGITAWLAVTAVLFTFLLAVVAARVSGETGITPVGPMGKVTQLLFGVLSPGNAAANLMAANVTGGAASQTGDLLHDMKCGLLLGASPRFQALAQVFGVAAGALAGSAVYLILVPDPASQLLTPEWPAPAVVTWKAVAEVFMKGLDTMPPGAFGAIAIAAAAGAALALAEKLSPKAIARRLPSPASMGLAMVIPADSAISMFLGGVLVLVAGKVAPRWSALFATVIAAGAIAGESLTGVAVAVHKMFAG